ncbi:MAG TPA: 2-oxo-4-hydroxy-4-carboxy-5-ureidoimidazoline decarboxylase [Vicinamibacterales bacterium]|jgi:2-oxo-4-hydroxy-4-carboxy-5-ureidoimidazoline decarboxylase|nr:2-oxo-4-hydroxy-4-carboxy-5-ureidoimidazoline decarboxylase [Vicinamibacterales bacterium]
MTLAGLNSCDRQSFVHAIGWVFEGSPWVAERAWAHRPFNTLNQLHDAMANEVAAAGSEERLALLRAHPDLGTKAPMSSASESEQAGAGLDALTGAELAELRKLNSAYVRKFGFPFLYAVKGSTKRDILKALEARLPRTREVELNEALRQVSRIAKLRLEETIRP